jgi:serine/threonine-protein kinase
VVQPQPKPIPVPPDSAPREAPRVIGRYAVYGEIGSGGMATVYFGRLRGAGGFSRPVAIKRLHPHFAKTPRFVDAFLDEARLAAQIRHPNVVPTLDVVAEDGELLLVMEYIAGASLSELWDLEVAHNKRIPPKIAASILAGALHGLNAAHEAKDEDGNPLAIVHRDVSPHNIIVGIDGVTRVLDFGVAKAEQRIRTTNPGEVKGKLAYMAPEQIMLEHASARSDIYSAGVVLWEALTGELLFRAENHGSLISKILSDVVKPPSEISPEVPGIPRALDAIVMKALGRNAEERYASAREMAHALEEEIGLASTREVGEWVVRTAGEAVARRAERAAVVERARPSAVDALWEVSEIDALDAANSTDAENTDATGEHSASEEEPDAPPAIEVREEPKRRTRTIAIVLALLSVGIVGAYAWATMRVPQVAPPPATPMTATPTALTIPTSTSTSTSTSPPTPTPTDPPTATVRKIPTAAAPPASTAPPPPASARRPDCSTPFTVDADGIKHLKRECL